jgi:5-histidylcysteine sulfoxide synthase
MSWIDSEILNTSSAVSSINPVGLKGLDRNELRSYFKNTWDLYELLFSAIDDNRSYVIAPDPLRNPLIFYYGHTAVFYINKLVAAGLIEEGINSRYESLFAKGVDPELPEHLQNELTWPSVEDTAQYRSYAYDLILSLIDRIEIPEQVTSDHAIWALLMGIEHDRIHFETSSVLIRQLESHLLTRPDEWNYASVGGFKPEEQWIHCQGGIAHIGQTEPATIFGWDNEFGSEKKSVPPFQVTKNLVSNAEFMEFVQSGSYGKDQFWSEEALEWKRRTNTQHPKFWVESESGFQYRAMFDVLDMPTDWPVEVNGHEALAYCRWKGVDTRLLSEAEFNVLSGVVYRVDEPVVSREVNLNLFFGSPSPVGSFESDQVLINDLFGNVWDWLSDDFYPLKGFQEHPLYSDFSSPYFDDKHTMLLGGSWATTGAATSKYYRLWFRRNFFQHAGFRLARSKHSSQ